MVTLNAEKILSERCRELKAFSVARFIEKPDSALAQTLIDPVDIYGIPETFAWNLQTFASALERQAPVLSQGLDHIKNVSDNSVGRDLFRFSHYFN